MKTGEVSDSKTLWKHSLRLQWPHHKVSALPIHTDLFIPPMPITFLPFTVTMLLETSPLCAYSAHITGKTHSASCLAFYRNSGGSSLIHFLGIISQASMKSTTTSVLNRLPVSFSPTFLYMTVTSTGSVLLNQSLSPLFPGEHCEHLYGQLYSPNHQTQVSSFDSTSFLAHSLNSVAYHSLKN